MCLPAAQLAGLCLQLGLGISQLPIPGLQVCHPAGCGRSGIIQTLSQLCSLAAATARIGKPVAAEASLIRLHRQAMGPRPVIALKCRLADMQHPRRHCRAMKCNSCRQAAHERRSVVQYLSKCSLSLATSRLCSCRAAASLLCWSASCLTSTDSCCRAAACSCCCASSKLAVELLDSACMSRGEDEYAALFRVQLRRH